MILRNPVRIYGMDFPCAEAMTSVCQCFGIRDSALTGTFAWGACSPSTVCMDTTGLNVWKACRHGPRSSLQNHNLPVQQGVLAQAQHSTPGPALRTVKVSSNLSAHTHLDISSWFSNTFLLCLPNSQRQQFWQSQSKCNCVIISFLVAVAHEVLSDYT